MRQYIKNAVYFPACGVSRARMSSGVIRPSDKTHTRESLFDNVTDIPRLHIADYDSTRGIPVEARFKTAALEITPAVFRYRRRELTDLAQTANLAEEAVYKANRALYGRACGNIAGYIFTIYKR